MYGNVTDDALTGFAFSVKVPGGGQAIDMSNTDFVYTSSYVIPPQSLVPPTDLTANILGQDPVAYPDDCAAWPSNGYPKYDAFFPEGRTLDGIPTGSADPILQPGASAIYTVCIGYEDQQALISGDWFSLEMIPQVGAPTLVTKRIDAGLQDGRPLL